jgi:hypothetical protein
LYAELMRNISTRSKPDGGAMSSVVERFVAEALRQSREKGTSPQDVIHERLQDLSEMTGGYDFAAVIAAYWSGHDSGNEQLKSDAVRWLRGEFSTRTDARNALGVRTIVDDASIYDHLKLMARFVRHAGFNGMMVLLDELVNIYKLANAQARNGNYEQILRILNDSFQGISVGLGFLFGGTPEFLLDTRRGLYSYPALQSRLAENTFATQGLVDYTSPVVRLGSLSQEDFYVLLTKLRHVFASGDATKYLVPEEALTAFMEHCAKRIGEAYFRTPRTTITSFVNLLSVLEQNPQSSWRELLGRVEVVKDEGTEAEEPPEPSETPSASDDLASFRL